MVTYYVLEFVLRPNLPVQLQKKKKKSLMKDHFVNQSA